MAGISKEDKAALLRFNIAQTIQIKLTQLKVHAYLNKGVKFHKCHHLCEYSSKFKYHVKRHLQSHTGEKPFACNLCNYKTTVRGTLNKHILTHTGDKDYSCAVCTKSFTRNSNKSRHEIICKLNPRRNDPSWAEMLKKFKCQLCPYSTVDKFHLRRHMRTHTGEKPFACNICNTRFSCRAGLRGHIFTHTREKPHSCQFCRKGFARTTHQKSHEKICKLNPKHGDAKWVEEQKKIKCHLCKYRTTQKHSLELHIRSHTGEKPYNCNLCVYKCSQNSHLHRHLRQKH